jgi:hypothetical protein
MNVSQALDKIKNSLKSSEVAHMVEFIEASKRGILDGSSADTISHRKNRSPLEAETAEELE